MQIVIDIPDDKYEWIKDHKGLTTYPTTMMLYNRVRKGIALPKNHGRLIDADDIALIDEQFYTRSDYYVAESAIDDAPTIIEADKAESEEQA